MTGVPRRFAISWSAGKDSWLALVREREKDHRRALAEELLARGVQARIACVDTRFLDASFGGASYDREFLDRIPDAVCPCGEAGEFHTLVTGGPGFSAPLRVRSFGLLRAASQPPFTPTEFVFDRLDIDSAAEDAG